MSEDYDTQGFDEAYKADSGLHQQGDTLYVAGTRNMDHVKEWWKIPGFKVKDTEIYNNTSKYLKDHPEVKNVVGHSFGGSVALELQKGDSRYNTRTYGAPVFDLMPRNPFHKPQRYCNRGDPVCALDYGAKKKDYVNPFNPNPHSYWNAPKPNSTTKINKGHKLRSHQHGFIIANS